MKSFHTQGEVTPIGVTSILFKEFRMNTLSWGQSQTHRPEQPPKPEPRAGRNLTNFLSALLQILVIVAILL